jgi:protein TonB
MSRTLAAKTVAQESSAEEAQELAFERSSEEPDQSPVALLSNWTPPVARPPTNRREIFAVVFFSALLHAGVATAAYQKRDAKPSAKPFSRVEIEVARPPTPPKPLVAPPPPPPKVIKQEVKQLAAVAPRPEQPESPQETTPAPQEPVDTGSSAPSDAAGELYAGSGGLGTAAPAPPAPPPAPVVAPAAPEPVIQAREGANYLKNPRPAYPGRAKREGWEGTTLLRVQVQPSGKPGAIKVQKSSGREILDEAASEAVKKWTFAPATQGGKPVGGWVTVPIVFRLQ